MNVYNIYEEDNKFEGEESIYYILIGKGGTSRLSNNKKYYIITRSAVVIYDIKTNSMVNDIKIITWPISCEEYINKEKNAFQNEYIDGAIYKVVGRLQYNPFGHLAFLYVKEVLEKDTSGTVLDALKEKYIEPFALEDTILGELVLDKDSNLFEGKYNFNDKNISIYIEVEWRDEEMWKNPLAVARDFILNIKEKDKELREYIAADSEVFSEAIECVQEYEDECEIRFSTEEEFASELKGRLTSIFVNKDGAYTIGYNDGYIFGGHEIDVDVDCKGKIICVEIR